ncbi:hypothetical protein [Cohnella boryungensis]|uniref:Uncharacterized protein n=1 Tax=Cohnella boryungensis TaxID=768479 RepID=A0ABV8SBE1_9BACL
MKATRLKVSLSILILSVALSACASDSSGTGGPSPTAQPTATEPVPSETASAEPTDEPDELVVKTFRDEAVAGAPADQVYTAFKLAMNKIQHPAQADDLVRALDAYYDKQLDAIDAPYEPNEVQQALYELEWPITAAEATKLKDDEIRELVERTLTGGYKLESVEGYIFPIVDYGKLLSFGHQASIPMKAYLELMATESDAMVAMDGGIVITLDDLAARTLASESYVLNFPDTPERAKVEERYLQYLNLLFTGLNNTPIFDYDTFLVEPDVKRQFEQLASAHSGTITGKLAQELLDILKETNDQVFTKDKKGEQTDIPEMKTFRDQLESAARSKLPAIKSNK